ncbi:hypothetical protein [Delftia sp. 60]|uniref:hypothetical protein n=1 Tax=Delftia sp. 60 TaxID=2035216 RepID=UPI00211E8FBD|nr:hypothetical protein [Delftia sp. 60]
MQLSEEDQQNSFVAALIHDIAHITLADGMLNKPVPSLSHEELENIGITAAWENSCFCR